MAAGVLREPINHEEVIAMGRHVRNEFAVLLTETIRKMP
jgi:purine nucleoside phosphorylase